MITLKWTSTVSYSMLMSRKKIAFQYITTVRKDITPVNGRISVHESFETKCAVNYTRPGFIPASELALSFYLTGFFFLSNWPFLSFFLSFFHAIIHTQMCTM